MNFGTRNPRNLNPSSSMELKSLLKFCEPQFLYFDNGDNISYLIHFIGSFNEIRIVKSLTQSLIYNSSINVSLFPVYTKTYWSRDKASVKQTHP